MTRKANLLLTETLGDVNACIQVLDLSHRLRVDTRRWREENVADRQRDCKELGDQVVDAVGGNLRALKDQLDQEHVDFAKFVADLEAAGADTRSMLQHWMDAMSDSLQDGIARIERLVRAGQQPKKDELPVFGIPAADVTVYMDRVLGAGG